MTRSLADSVFSYANLHATTELNDHSDSQNDEFFFRLKDTVLTLRLYERNHIRFRYLDFQKILCFFSRQQIANIFQLDCFA